MPAGRAQTGVKHIVRARRRLLLHEHIHTCAQNPRVFVNTAITYHRRTRAHSGVTRAQPRIWHWRRECDNNVHEACIRTYAQTFFPCAAHTQWFGICARRKEVANGVFLVDRAPFCRV